MDDFNCCPLTLSSVLPQNLIIFISIILTFFFTVFFLLIKQVELLGEK